MDYIKTIEELIENLDEADLSEHSRLMKRIKLDAKDLNNYTSWCKKGYTRNCLARTDEYELILLCWDLAAETPIHDHGGEDCWVYQIQGRLEEKRFIKVDDELIEKQRIELNPGQLTYMHDRMGFHSLKNLSNTSRAMTLHIYTSPIDRCNVYNETTECFENKEMSYHTFKGMKTVLSISK